MNIILVGAELEENLGLNYMASALEKRGHCVNIVPFNSGRDIPLVVEQAVTLKPGIIGLSMVFTGRAREFCRLAQALRTAGFTGHLIAGGHFASFNCQKLLSDYPQFDSIGLGEGELLMCQLAEHLDDYTMVPALCWRQQDGTITINPAQGNADQLDALPFPKRTTFHDYYGKPIASILSSRGCWRNCSFCSINAWYEKVGGKKFRYRSIENIVMEMKQLYFDYGVRIFNFQDDNFFLPDPEQAVARFRALRTALQDAGVEGIAIAVKARPDSIHYDSIAELDQLGLFRVFLGVENASVRGLRNLNRKCTLEAILNALKILNDFDVHVAYNLLMFEPDTTMDDILINLRFMERHIDNPFNFCRAEAYEGTGLAYQLRQENRLLGDYFGFDYRLKNAQPEAFHYIANYAFFERNFSDFGLHYFNMQVDFCFQLLRRFFPGVITQAMRSAVKNFIKETNLDTYQYLSEIYDYVMTHDVKDLSRAQRFAEELKWQIGNAGKVLHERGEVILDWLNSAYETREQGVSLPNPLKHGCEPTTQEWNTFWPDNHTDLFGVLPGPIPYQQFRRQMDA